MERRMSYKNSVMRLLVMLMLVALYTTSGLQNMFGSRRHFVATMTTAAGTLVTPEPSVSESTSTEKSSDKNSLSSKLLSIIPVTRSGAPATNATLPIDVVSGIESFVSFMEQESSTTRNKQNDNAISPILSGSWRLLYSNAPEIVGLAKGLPLGFFLGPTYQPLDTAKGFFENTAKLDHPYKLATLQTIVVGTIEPSPKGSVNAANVVNNKNNRVIVNFEVIAFELDSLLGIQIQPPIRKTIVSRAPKEGIPLPANDQTYLDERVRIVRGGDGSLFVFSRESRGDFVPRSAEERAEIVASASASFRSTTLVGEDLDREKGKTSKEIPAEIEYLFRKQR